MSTHTPRHWPFADLPHVRTCAPRTDVPKQRIAAAKVFGKPSARATPAGAKKSARKRR